MEYHHCKPSCMGMKLLLVGIALILIRLYTTWDIWIVIGALVVLKAIMLMLMPVCPCNKQKEVKKK